MDDLDALTANLAIQSGLPFLLSGPNGEIFGANASFCELVGYTEFELRRKGWVTLSVNDEDLQADQNTLLSLVEGHILSYSVVKSFVSKSGTPIPGHLTVIRHPQSREDLIRCLCWFVPLANGSKAALNLVVAYIERHTNATHEIAEKIATMSQDLQLKKKQTVGQRLWDSLGEWALENPKTATVVFLVILALNPYPIVVTWVTRMGWLPAQPVQIEMKNQETGQFEPAQKEELERLVGFHH